MIRFSYVLVRLFLAWLTIYLLKDSLFGFLKLTFVRRRSTAVPVCQIFYSEFVSLILSLSGLCVCFIVIIYCSCFDFCLNAVMILMVAAWVVQYFRDSIVRHWVWLLVSFIQLFSFLAMCAFITHLFLFIDPKGWVGVSLGCLTGRIWVLHTKGEITGIG